MNSYAFVTLAGFFTGNTKSLGSCISGHSPDLEKLNFSFFKKSFCCDFDLGYSF